ncbi:MAG: bifunctional methylenetetrahydrofolate dehydrogenase/methenyltetrahydrofolate cyclohydrolase, partial [Candidatus Dadabacteria bacterium]
MGAMVIDGKALAAKIRSALAENIQARLTAGKRPPGLATILVGDNPASRVYVRRKQREAREVGIHSEAAELPASTSREELLGVIRAYNERPEIDGIIVQLPLPDHLDA